MPEQHLQWYKGALDNAAKRAAADGKVLLVCLFSDSKQKADLEQKLTSPSLLSLLAKDCVVFCLLKDTEDEKALSRLFSISSFPLVMLVHPSGTVKLTGNDINEKNIELHIGKKLESPNNCNNDAISSPSTPTTPLNTIENEEILDWQSREAERLRKKLAKQRAKDAVYIKQLRANIKDDRKTYNYIHRQESSTAQISRTPSAASLADESLRNTFEGIKQCRLLFRANDGQMVSGDFARDATLGEVKLFLERKLGISRGDIEVAKTLPRIVLGKDHDEKTLLELQLVPSATLLLRFSAKPAVKTRARSGLSLRPLLLLFALLALILAAWAPRRKTNLLMPLSSHNSLSAQKARGPAQNQKSHYSNNLL